MVCCSGAAADMTAAILAALYEAMGPVMVERFIGGSFDGASAMMGSQTGVQQRLKGYFLFVCDR